MCQKLDLRFLPFIAFYQVFSRPLFRFFDLAFYCLLSFFDLVFLSHFVFPLLFHSCFVLFFAHVVSSLTYPNLLRNKRLGYCCCCKQRTLLILVTVASLRLNSINMSYSVLHSYNFTVSIFCFYCFSVSFNLSSYLLFPFAMFLWFPSLACPNLLGTKRLCCYCMNYYVV
jgi:hypothetical protein